MSTKFNLEVNARPVPRIVYELLQRVKKDRTSTENQVDLALAIKEVATTLDALIVQLQYGLTCLVEDDRMRRGVLKDPPGSPPSSDY
jgi:hypothetical protein